VVRRDLAKRLASAQRLLGGRVAVAGWQWVAVAVAAVAVAQWLAVAVAQWLWLGVAMAVVFEWGESEWY
jgi:hypothetical protein